MSSDLESANPKLDSLEAKAEAVFQSLTLVSLNSSAHGTKHKEKMYSPLEGTANAQHAGMHDQT